MVIEKEKFFEIIKNVSESKDLNENNLLEKIKNELLKKDEGKYSTYNDLRIDKMFSVLVDSGKIVNYTLLHLAVECENARVVECLLKNNRIKVDETIYELDGAKSKLTALHIAALHGSQEIIQLLLDNNANPLSKNSEGKTPRDVVDNAENKEVIKMLEEGEIRYTKSQSEARATRMQTYRSSNILLQPNSKASEDYRNNEQTSSNSIINKNNTNKVDDTLEREQALREREAKAQQLQEAEQQFAANRKRVEQEYLHNQYPGQCALHSGKQDSLDLTTDEVNSNDSGIYVPTEEAHEDLAKYLEEYEGDVDAKDGTGRTFLHFAVETNNEKSVKLLIARGADVNAQDKDKRTPLHFAAAMNGMGIVKYLVENRADVNVQDKDERTPLHFAAAMSGMGIVKYLVENRADVNAQDKDGRTPLCYALTCRDCNDTEVVTYLVENGASISDQNTNMDKHKISRPKQSEVATSHFKTNNVTEIQERTRKLSVKLKRSRARLEEGQKENQSLKRKIHDLENENVALKNKLEKTKNQHSETNKVSLEKAQKDLVELKNCVAGHETRLEAFNKLNEENKSLKQEIEDLKSENATLKDELEKNKNQHSNYVAENETKQEALNEQNQEKSKLQEQEIKNLKSENAKLNSELEETKNRHSKYVTEHKAELEALNKQNQEKNKSQEQEIKNLRSENAKLNSELEKNKNQHSQTSEVSLKKVEKKPPLSKVAYISLVATFVVGSILSIFSGLFVLSMIVTSVASALVVVGITYTMSKPTTELKEVNIQSPNNKAWKFNLE